MTVVIACDVGQIFLPFVWKENNFSKQEWLWSIEFFQVFDPVYQHKSFVLQNRKR